MSFMQYHAASLLLLFWLQVMAAEALQFACNHCHKEGRSQMRRILHFLIPVQMLLGKLPSVRLRQKYQMHAYDTMIEVRD